MFMLSSGLDPYLVQSSFFLFCVVDDTKILFIYIHSFQLCTKKISRKKIPTYQQTTDLSPIHLVSNLPDPSIRNDTSRQPTRTRSARHILSLEVNQRIRTVPTQRPTASKRIQLASMSQIARTLGIRRRGWTAEQIPRIG